MRDRYIYISLSPPLRIIKVCITRIKGNDTACSSSGLVSIAILIIDFLANSNGSGELPDQTPSLPVLPPSASPLLFHTALK